MRCVPEPSRDSKEEFRNTRVLDEKNRLRAPVSVYRRLATGVPILISSAPLYRPRSSAKTASSTMKSVERVFLARSFTWAVSSAESWKACNPP